MHKAPVYEGVAYIRKGHIPSEFNDTGPSYDREPSFRNLVKAIGVGGKLAWWNGHSFELSRIVSRGEITGYWLVHLKGARRAILEDNPPQERIGVAYYPVDPRLIESDVAGAIRAYPNETHGTHWLFQHTDEGTHHDYELRLLSACDGVFQPYFRQLTVDGFSTSATARATARNRFTLLSEFYGDVIQAARTAARATFLGEREQQAHPKEGWLDRDITTAVNAVEAAWKADTDRAPTNLLDLSQAIIYLKRSLAMPSVETRWDRAARLEAERKAAEAAVAAEEGGAGDGSGDSG